MTLPLASGVAADVGALGPPWVVALLFVVLFAASFVFSGTETAFFSLQELDRRRLEESPSSTHRRIVAVLRERTALITTVLIGNETVNIAIASTSAALLAAVAPDRPWLTVVIVTPVLVLLSEVTPKILAFRFNRLWVDLVVWPLSLLQLVLWPVRVVVAGLVAVLARPFGVTRVAPEREVGEEEFLAFVEQGEEQGIVGEEERELIEAVFDLDDLPVARVMTPKPDVFAVPVDVAWDDLLAACQDARFSRVPVWEGSPDNIVGVLLLKDLLRHRRQPFRSPEQLRRLLLPPVFVPTSKPANEMMKEMLKRRFHMAFVVDEHGTVVGLVSLDDLIIELVGEIEDEPSPEEVDDVQRDGDGWNVRASVGLDDLADLTGVALPTGDYHTVAGFVLESLGRIPDPGDVVGHEGWQLTVLSVEDRRIVDVRLGPAPAAADAGGAA
jgi:CBS domain containing-hemolysin-like protein